MSPIPGWAGRAAGGPALRRPAAGRDAINPAWLSAARPVADIWRDRPVPGGRSSHFACQPLPSSSCSSRQPRQPIRGCALRDRWLVPSLYDPDFGDFERRAILAGVTASLPRIAAASRRLRRRRCSRSGRRGRLLGRAPTVSEASSSSTRRRIPGLVPQRGRPLEFEVPGGPPASAPPSAPRAPRSPSSTPRSGRANLHHRRTARRSPPPCGADRLMSRMSLTIVDRGDAVIPVVLLLHGAPAGPSRRSPRASTGL